MVAAGGGCSKENEMPDQKLLLCSVIFNLLTPLLTRFLPGPIPLLSRSLPVSSRKAYIAIPDYQNPLRSSLSTGSISRRHHRRLKLVYSVSITIKNPIYRPTSFRFPISAANEYHQPHPESPALQIDFHINL